MKILKELYRLPPQIEYLGFIFSLQLRNDTRGNMYLGYYVTNCTSKKKYKKACFQLGIWSEKDRVTLSSVQSDYLFKVLVFDEQKAVQALINEFKNNRLPLRDLEGQTIEAEFQEYNLNLSISKI